MGDPKIDELNKSYDELLNEFRAESKDSKPKESSSPSSDSVFNSYSDSLDKYSDLKIPAFESPKKKKGFFSGLFGNKKKENLNTYSDFSQITKESIINKTKTNDSFSSDLPLKLEKDFLDAEQEYIDEPQSSDFISNKVILSEVKQFDIKKSAEQNIPMQKSKNEYLKSPDESVFSEVKSGFSKNDNEFDDIVNKIRANLSESQVNETGMNKTENEKIGIEKIKNSNEDLQKYIEKLKNEQNNISKSELSEIESLKNDELSLSSRFDTNAKDTSVLKNTVDNLLSKQQEMDELKSEFTNLKTEISKMNDTLAITKTKSQEAQENVVKISTSLSEFVNRSQLDKLKEMITQINVYVDTFDDRERELEKKYQTIKDLISRLELLEVQIQKQRTDNDDFAKGLQDKVNFVYKYLQQVQNSIYVLSKSVDLSKEEKNKYS